MPVTKQKESVPFFYADDPYVDHLFSKVSPNAQRRRKARFSEAPIEVVRGIMSNDPLYVKFLDRLSMDLYRSFKPDLSEWGYVGSNGLISNFLNIRVISGLGMKYPTYPLADNDHLRESKGLSNRIITPWHEHVLRALIRLFFGNLQPAKVKINPDSSTCLPECTRDITRKHILAEEALVHFPAVGRLLEDGNYEAALIDYKVGGATQVVFRQQSTDGVTHDDKTGQFSAKDRESSDLEYALTGGRTGHIYIADKTIDQSVTQYSVKGFFRRRKRVAMGAPWSLNVPLNVISSAVRDKIFGEFGYTYHHTSRANKEEKLRAYDALLATDVSQHDIMWPSRIVIPILKDELRNIGIAEAYVQYVDLMFKIPILVMPFEPDSKGVVIGDWRKPDLNMGMCSGTTLTDTLGCLVMTWVYSIMMFEHLMPEKIPNLSSVNLATPVMRSLLLGLEPAKLQDKSDDAIIGVNGSVYVDRLATLMGKMIKDEQVSPYMIIGYEKGAKLLGDIPLFGSSQKCSSITMIGDIGSFVTNSFCHEYSIDSRERDRSKTSRPFPDIAWGSVQDVYGSCPLFGEVLEKISKHWRDVFGIDYVQMKREYLMADEKRLNDFISSRFSSNFKYGDMSLQDKIVLENRQAIHYKVDERDISPEILKMVSHEVNPSLVEKTFNYITSGK